MRRTTQMNDPRGWLSSTSIAVLVLVGHGWAVPSTAQDVAPIKPATSSVLVAVPGTPFAVAPGPCMPTGDIVSLAGDMHVVTLVRQGVLMQVHLNLSGVQGTGQSGNLYIGTGAQKFTALGPVPNSDMPPLTPSFTLEHTDGCAADKLSIPISLNFDTIGNLIGARLGIPDNGPALTGVALDADLPAGGLRAVEIEMPDAAAR